MRRWGVSGLVSVLAIAPVVSADSWRAWDLTSVDASSGEPPISTPKHSLTTCHSALAGAALNEK